MLLVACCRYINPALCWMSAYIADECDRTEHRVVAPEPKLELSDEHSERLDPCESVLHTDADGR